MLKILVEEGEGYKSNLKNAPFPKIEQKPEEKRNFETDWWRERRLLEGCGRLIKVIRAAQKWHIQ